MAGKTAVIIGAGPAGLTAAFELLSRTDIRPVVLEKSTCMGGIARTEVYKGNRIDLGGHRFFSKSDRVVNWWLERLPLEKDAPPQPVIGYHGITRRVSGVAEGPDPAVENRVMLLRDRKSRIYFLRRLFEYPIQFNTETLFRLGLRRAVRIVVSYLRAALFPPRPIVNLEQFFISRFGAELYRTFFKSYTEKVWGVPCSQISAEWGAQRVKGLSVGKALLHFLTRGHRTASKQVETSLIEHFLYPKFGPGQMWEEVARQVRAMGGEILTGMEVTRFGTRRNRIPWVEAMDAAGEGRRFPADYVFSTMPLRELVGALEAEVPPEVRRVSDGLCYRDFITVGLLLSKLKLQDNGARGRRLIRDNWIYLQEPEVRASRVQIFNNWSPYLLADPSRVWIGVEYLCGEGDDLWQLPDREMAELAARELAGIGIIDRADLLDHTVLRMPKAYPAYVGTYQRFAELRAYLDEFENLFLIGRNGMHRYNNQDHSMLTAMTAVDNILSGRIDKTNLWEINTEMDYHEGPPATPAAEPPAEVAAGAASGRPCGYATKR